MKARSPVWDVTFGSRAVSEPSDRIRRTWTVAFRPPDRCRSRSRGEGAVRYRLKLRAVACPLLPRTGPPRNDSAGGHPCAGVN